VASVPATPVASEPAETEPAETEPAASEPAETEPAASEPAASEPAASEPAASEPTGEGVPGGTIYILTQSEQFDHVDPQRIYTGEDLAFFGATIMRSLTNYTYTTDPVAANTLQPDMATDTGTPNEDATSWQFTLKDGLTWEDGSAVTCEDVKYGVSRTFATDVITDGPTYALVYLDVPTNEDGTSQYPGPYSADEEQQALFDEAVSCDGNTITFNLNQPVADFNYTVTLGFGAVPNPTDHEGVDVGEEYDLEVWSNGPYMIDTYQTGEGGNMTLVRNPNWDPASDPMRKAYPDQWVVNFGLDPAVIDQRLIASTGEDATAILYGNVQPENLTTVFADPQTPNAEFEGRAVSDFDPYSLYYWINTQKVPVLEHRLAIAAALDREALRQNAGGEFAGEFGDGVIKPNIGGDYAPTGFWGPEGPFGEEVPDTGSVEIATRLLEESGEEPPPLTFDYGQSPTNDRSAAIVEQNLEAAGFQVELNPIESGAYYSTVLDPELQNEIGTAGWGPDWPNASTVIPPLFTDNGGFNLSRVTEEDDPDWYARIQDALGTLDRQEQMTKWQELNKYAVEQGWVVPTRFGLTQVLAGTRVGPQPIYQWAPYGSWPYAEMYVIPE
jgi:peptide/nickel transport system substrate-binding protein